MSSLTIKRTFVLPTSPALVQHYMDNTSSDVLRFFSWPGASWSLLMHETSLHHPRTRLNVTEKRVHLAGVCEFTVSAPEFLTGELNPALQRNCSGNLRVITSSYHFLPLSCIFCPPPRFNYFFTSSSCGCLLLWGSRSLQHCLFIWSALQHLLVILNHPSSSHQR